MPSYQERVKSAVDDPDWQKFRLSLKGMRTVDKISMLEDYFDTADHDWQMPEGGCPTCIRIDNYIKALCRGGQLYPGESLDTMLKSDWCPRIKR